MGGFGGAHETLRSIVPSTTSNSQPPSQRDGTDQIAAPTRILPMHVLLFKLKGRPQ